MNENLLELIFNDVMKNMALSELSLNRKLIHHFAVFANKYLYNLNMAEKNKFISTATKNAASKKINTYRHSMAEKYLFLFAKNMQSANIDEFSSLFFVIENIGMNDPQFIPYLMEVAKTFGLLFHDYPDKIDLKKQITSILVAIRKMKYDPKTLE